MGNALDTTRGVKNWAVGITTAPRRKPTLAQCAESFSRAGWTGTIFAEPKSCPRALMASGAMGWAIEFNPDRLGAWHNWREAARFLLENNPGADAILLVQDDVEVAQGAKDFVERDLWPEKSVGLVNLYTAAHYSRRFVVYDSAGQRVSHHINEQAATNRARRVRGTVKSEPRPPGCWSVSAATYWGCCACVFQPDVLRRIIDHPIAKNWKGAGTRAQQNARRPEDVANVDTCIGRVIDAINLPIKTYTPALAQHFAEFSSLGHGDASGRRKAMDFVGVDANLDEIFGTTTRARWNSDGTLRTAPPSSPESHYDAHYQAGGFGHSMIRQRQQVEQLIVKPLGVGPGSTVVDLGCGQGMHTEIFRSIGCDVLGVDLSAEGIALARRSYPECRFECWNAANLGNRIGRDSVDLMFCRGMSWFHYELNGINRKGVDVPAETARLFAFVAPGGHFVLQIKTDFSGRVDPSGVLHNRYSEYVSLFAPLGDIVSVVDWQGRPLRDERDASKSRGNICITVRNLTKVSAIF